MRLPTAQGYGLTLAHGIGGSTDLPIPATYALVGASWALAISFVILGFASRTSRFRGDESGRPIPRAVAAVVDNRFARDCLRLVGLAFTAYVAMGAFLGKDLLTNPTFGVVYVLLWVGMLVSSLLLGPVWPLLSPVRTIHLVLSKTLRTNPEVGVVAYPSRLGYWPAAAGLLGFVWLELVKTPVYLAPIVLWFGVYFALMFVGSALFGTRWFERTDPFEVYFGLAGVISSHDRAVRLLPRKYALLSQLPLLILMVGYTIGGLTLLLST